MSDEQRKEDETTEDEVEGHGYRVPADTGPPVEGEDDEVEAHRMRKTNSRLD